MNNQYICDICNVRIANYQFYENINGTEKSRHICQICLDKIKSTYYYSGYNGSTGFKKNLDINSAVIKRCPVCRMSENEVLETGYAGCSECYKTFANLYIPMVMKVQGSDRHKGKSPQNRIKVSSEILKEIENLIAERTRAIAEERYDDSQKLTDRINKIKEGYSNE